MPAGKKIAVVVPKYGLVGGAERFAAEVTERLARSTSHKFHVFAQQWNAPPDSPVVFHKIPTMPFPRSLRPRGFAWLVQRALDRDDFDLVHSHERLFRADIVTLHCIPHRLWVQEIRVKQPSWFDREMIAVEERMIRAGANTTFLPVSTIAREMFQRAYGELPGRWQVMHPGVDCARFASPDREQCRAEVRARYGLKKNAFVVLFVGMNFELKGVDTIMESVALARRQRPEAGFHLLVVGRGQIGRYLAKARTLEVADAVTFVGEVTNNIEEYYGGSDAFMLLSAFDTFGMVVLEAMAAGTSVIVGRNVGARDIVQHGSSGFIMDNHSDARTAARHLCELCHDDTSRRFGVAAARTAAGSDWQQTINLIAHAYEASLHDRRRK